MKNNRRLKITSIYAGVVLAALLATGAVTGTGPYDLALRLTLALESASTSVGGGVLAAGDGPYDLQLRSAVAAEELASKLSGVTGVSFTPTNYTASATNAEGHLIGVDVALGAVVSAGVADGDKGDVTVSGAGTVWTLDAVYQPTNGYLTDLAADGIITNLAGRTLAVTAVAGSEGIVAAIRRATGQTNDILQIQDASNGYLAGFASNGVLRTPGIILGTNDVITNWNVGTGDFLADGSVPMTGALDAGGNAVTNLDNEVYDATGWNGDTSAASKDAVRDKIETISISGANWVASGTTNSTLGGRLYAHGGYFTNDLTVAGSGSGAVLVADSDQSNYGGLKANATTTTDTILNLPAAPAAGVVTATVSDTTNWVLTASSSASLGTPTATTPAEEDNDTSVATTAYVQTELADQQPLDSDLTTYAARPAAWTSVTLDTTNAVIDLASAVPGVDKNFYYSLSTSNYIVFSNLVQGAQGTIWINAAATAREINFSSSYDNFSTNEIAPVFTVTNRAIIAYKVGWGTDATNVMLAIKRK